MTPRSVPFVGYGDAAEAAILHGPEKPGCGYRCPSRKRLGEST